MEARALLAEFIELETQFAAILRARIERRMVTEGADLDRAAKAGQVTEVMQRLAAPEEFSRADRRKMEMLALHCITLGAASVSDRSVRMWRNPKGRRLEILDRALLTFQTLDADYVRPELSAAALSDLREQLNPEDDAGIDITKDDKPKPKKKPRDLVPQDFGYTPLLKPPDWVKTRGKVKDSAFAATEFAANLTTSRLINYGALESMLVENIGLYRIKAVMDARTSRICRTMNGRTFEVRDGIELLERALTVTSPAELKAVHPWMPSKNEQLVELAALSAPGLKERGYLVPPFHPRCRSVVVRAGSRRTTKRFLGAFSADMLAKLGQQAPIEKLVTVPPNAMHLLDSYSLEMIIDAKNEGYPVPDALYNAAGAEMGIRDLTQ